MMNHAHMFVDGIIVDDLEKELKVAISLVLDKEAVLVHRIVLVYADMDNG